MHMVYAITNASTGLHEITLSFSRWAALVPVVNRLRQLKSEQTTKHDTKPCIALETPVGFPLAGPASIIGLLFACHASFHPASAGLSCVLLSSPCPLRLRIPRLFYSPGAP
jgi:hypothetical protein